MARDSDDVRVVHCAEYNIDLGFGKIDNPTMIRIGLLLFFGGLVTASPVFTINFLIQKPKSYVGEFVQSQISGDEMRLD